MNSIPSVSVIVPIYNAERYIKQYRNKNSGGAAIPRSIGIEMAVGKYIAFIDNDDLFTRDALQKLYSIAEQTGADVVHIEKHLSNVTAVDVINSDTKLAVVFNPAMNSCR